ncbi:MAG: tRNA-dihydrouridine synthase, partial [Dorea sp.]
EILEIYNKYPLEELIVHPRIQKEFYKNHPHLDVFEYAVKESKNTLCYNGDIFTMEADKTIKEMFPTIDKFMLGRGIVSNPGLLEEIKEGKQFDKVKFRQFHDEMFAAYEENSFGEMPVLFKMKEIWSFTKPVTREMEKAFKRMRKAESFAVYNSVIEEVFALLP